MLYCPLMRNRRRHLLLHVSNIAASSVAMLAIFSGCGDDPAPVTDAPANVTRPPTTVEGIVAQREHFDTTVFSDEVQAQTYEQAFVRLWDRILLGNAFAALKAFPFETLLLGKFDPPEQQDWGAGEFIIRRSKEPSESLSHDQFERRLDALEFDDWNIVQTEWHHSRFEPASDGQPAQSVVSAELHVAHDRRDHRFIIRAKLKVQWSDRRGGPSPIGAKVIARSGSRRWIHHVVSGDSFSTQHAFVAHFGLGSIKQLDFIEIHWPGGRVSRLERPAIGIYHRVFSPSTTKK